MPVNPHAAVAAQLPHQYRDQVLAAEVTKPRCGQNLLTVHVRRPYEKEVSTIKVDPWMLTGEIRDVIARTWPAAPSAADQLPDLLQLCDKVARLNPEAGEIGPGMLATLVTQARRIQANGGVA